MYLPVLWSWNSRWFESGIHMDLQPVEIKLAVKPLETGRDRHCHVHCHRFCHADRTLCPVAVMIHLFMLVKHGETQRRCNVWCHKYIGNILKAITWEGYVWRLYHLDQNLASFPNSKQYIIVVMYGDYIPAIWREYHATATSSSKYMWALSLASGCTFVSPLGLGFQWAHVSELHWVPRPSWFRMKQATITSQADVFVLQLFKIHVVFFNVFAFWDDVHGRSNNQSIHKSKWQQENPKKKSSIGQ